MEEYQPEKIILFGSYARGETDEYGDLDFVVIKKTGKRFLERLIEVAKLIGNDLGNGEGFVYTPKAIGNLWRLIDIVNHEMVIPLYRTAGCCLTNRNLSCQNRNISCHTFRISHVGIPIHNIPQSSQLY